MRPPRFLSAKIPSRLAPVLMAGCLSLFSPAPSPAQKVDAPAPAGAAGEPARPPGTQVIPIEGNCYLTSTSSSGRSGRSRGVMGNWSNADDVFSLYFRVDRPAELDIALNATVPNGESRIRAVIAGKTFEVDLSGDSEHAVPLGKVTVEKGGYVRIDLQGLRKSGGVFAVPQSLNIMPTGKDAAEVALNFVREGGGNRFYWGRRGPSVHLNYTLSQGQPAEWFYNEITVPEGSDPIGSYFMANGFGEGYFGMQVNSESERRILFSVWSPYSTDHPGEIPEDQKVILLKKGEGVHGGEFGGEGSGGQSYWNYPWKPGSTWRFLNRVRPDGKGSTVYTGWFFLPESKEWKLIASFKRPKTDKHLTGAHSFLENFSDRNGFLGRQAFYGNQWVCDVKGTWTEVTGARFTGDDIANRKYRMDFAGGAKADQFFLRNGGFFDDGVATGGRFTREPTPDKKPAIDFTKLDGVADGL